MINIIKKGNEVISTAYCDVCGAGIEWDSSVGIMMMECKMRFRGWATGDKHVCADCQSKGFPPGNVTSPLSRQIAAIQRLAWGLIQIP